MPQALFRYAVFQTLAIAFCGAVAIMRLRSVHRTTKETIVDPANVPPRELDDVIIVDRPPVSDEPLLWKAIHVEDEMQPRHGQRILFRLGKRETPEAARLHTRIFFLLSMVAPILALYGVAWWFNEPPQQMWNVIFRALSAMIGCFGWVRMTTQATLTVAGEREQRTLPDLLLTNMDRREILRQKLLGCMYRGLWPIVWVIGYGLVNVILGSVHILGLFLYLVLWLLYAVFFVSLAFWFSTISPTRVVAGRRVIMTIGMIVVGIVVTLTQLPQTRLTDGFVAGVLPPLPIGMAGMTPEQFYEAISSDYHTTYAVGLAVCLMLSTTVAGFLWRATIKRFERETGETILSR